MKYIYIASPYTIGSVAENVKRSIAVANALAGLGCIPFAPLLFHFWDWQCPHDYDFWIKQSKAWVEKCDVVLRLPGESSGADKEVEYAKLIGIPVLFGMTEFLEAYSRTK